MGPWSASSRQKKLEALLRTAVPDGGSRRFKNKDRLVSLDATPNPHCSLSNVGSLVIESLTLG